MAGKVSPRANAAGFWALILGAAAFLFQGREFYNWNDMSLVSAVLAIIYGFMISSGGRTRPLGMAGGSLGVLMLFDKLLFYEFQQIVRDFNQVLPEYTNAETLFTLGLIVASLYFVVFKPIQNENR